MDRYDLQELVSQDNHGVTYLAWDTVENQNVSINRFFPFGKDGGGLDQHQQLSFITASHRLTTLQHPALRSILATGIDPIDSMPYLVTEWIDGVPLSTLLADQPMDPARVIELLHSALEASIILSHILGEEAVWIATDIPSIIVGTEQTQRGFTFSISPLKILGNAPESRKISSLIDLAETLTGWRKKLVSDTAGLGLGGWLKWLKANPHTPLDHARQTLATSTGHQPPPPIEPLLPTPAKPSKKILTPKPSKVPLILTTLFACVAAILSLFYFLKPHENPPTTSTPSSEPTTPAPGKTTPTPTPSLPPPQPDAKARIAALNEKIRLENEARDAIQATQDAKTQALLEAQTKAAAASNGILTPDQFELIRTLKTGAPAQIKGTLRSLRISNSGKTIYLSFSDPSDKKQTNILAHSRDYKGTFTTATFTPFLGKTILATGKISIENFDNSYFVKITALDQLTPLD